MENYREQFNLKLRIVVYAPKDGKNAISDENIQVFCESKIGTISLMVNLIMVD